MRSNSYRIPISYKDIEALVKPNKPGKPKKSEPHPLDNIESQEDYWDLSVSIIADDPQTESRLPKSDLIKSVKQSLAELKNEATLYIHSGEKAIQENNKKLKESVFSIESSSPEHETLSILNELRQSVQILNERLEKNEERCTFKKQENLQLHELISRLEGKMKENKIKSSSKSAQCICLIN